MNNSDNIKNLARIELYVSLKKMQDMSQKRILNTCVFSLVGDLYLDICLNLLEVKRKNRKTRQKAGELMALQRNLEKQPISYLLR